MILDLPPRLYKYFAPERVAVLTQRLVRYTPLGAFNDPFEGRPKVTGLTTQDETISITNDLLLDETRQMYESLQPHVQAAIPFNQVYFKAKALAQEKGAEIHTILQSMTQATTEFLTGKLDEHLGAFCLSEVPDSILMWSHYGASHSGFALEFDSNHPHFHEQQSPEDGFRRLRRVFYRDTRPSSRLAAMSTTEMFLVKSSHWAYEREWRIMRAFSDANTVVQDAGYPVHLFAFPPQALTGVIVGARATAITSQQICNAIASNPELRHVQIKQAIPDSTHFHLKIENSTD